ncbi:helix-turn-helix domain-containing protein [Streptomyces smaragdinus]|uniref:helix-turn-helix domain-containing protein n=1 Tax=Streptomyces smaragdinus TaxID=2585196 RepID=UPI0012954E6E|nr:helix-turn-helix domain-containing protein [Streptomyces smaragdinus]
MTPSRARRGNAASALTPLYRPAEVAEALGCSEWWVKEQARRGRIPFTRTGGGFRFTAEHYQEIIRVFEERPACVAQPAAEEGPTVVPRRMRQIPPAAISALRAKQPRRAAREHPTRPTA